MANLQNLKMAFGDKNSPTAVNQEQIRTLIKAVNDTSLTTKEFSGYVSLASGSINAAEAYALGLAGITYIGATTAVEFSVTADKTTIADNDSVTFDSPEIPVSALVFSVQSVVVNEGAITSEQLKAKISFAGNVMFVASLGSVGEVQATVVVKVETRYTPTSVKEITLNVKVKTFNAINVNAESYNFDSTNIKTFELSYTPADATVAIESIAAEFNAPTATYEIISVEKDAIKIQCNSTETYESATINIAATDKNGNIIRKSFGITNKVIPNITITGDETFMSPNGNGSKVYLFGFNPIAYNVDVEVVSVTSNNAQVKIKEISLGGFTSYVEGISANQSATITAVLNVDGVSKTITKNVTANFINMSVDISEEGDLGLPSGIKWAACNVGADTPEGEGLYFQWGDTEGHAKDSGYHFSQATYDAKGLNAISADLSHEQDAANVNMGGTWRMPTKEEFQELRNNCNWSSTTQNGVSGYKITSKANGNFIFLPFYGGGNGYSFFDYGTVGYYWAKSYSNDTKSYRLYSSNSTASVSTDVRSFGFNVRAVSDNNPSFPKTYYVNTTNIESPTVVARMANDGNYGVSVDGMKVIVTCSDMSVVEENTLIVTVTDGATGVVVEKSVAVSNKIVPTISINGDASFVAENGTGSADYTFRINPADYNVDISFVSVTTNNTNVTVTNSSKDGFTLNASGLSANADVVVSAVFSVDGQNVTLTKSVAVTYRKKVENNGHEYVDLGLPSGLMWAKYNVGATTEEGEGLYFQWGDTEGHAKDSGYDFSQANYEAKVLNAISGDLALSQDAAKANMGGTWRMPTKEEFQELKDNCNWVWSSQNGVNGYKITSKINGNSIFFAAVGYYNGTTLNYFGSGGLLWSRSFFSSSNAHNLYFNSSNVNPQNIVRRYGFNVRAVL